MAAAAAAEPQQQGAIDLRRGDCAGLLRTVPTASIDMILTDPPYMTSDMALDRAFSPAAFDSIMPDLLRVLKHGGWFFCFGPLSVQVTPYKWFNTRFEYVWVKTNSVISSFTTRRPYLQHELIQAYTHPKLGRPSDLYFDRAALRTRGHPNYGARGPRKQANGSQYATEQHVGLRGFCTRGVTDHTRHGTSLLHFPNKGTFMRTTEKCNHPTQKPVALLETIVRGYCPPDGVVLDPYAGSGSTAVAARAAGRRAVAFEVDPSYFAMAAARCGNPLADAAGLPPVKILAAPPTH